MIGKYIKDIKKHDPLTKEAERLLLISAKSGDRDALEKVINSNLRFAFKIAKSYQGKGLPLEDLISEANLGLLKAYERFDLSRDVRFISYAVWWIRQSILSALYKDSNLIRMPLNKLVNVNKINTIKNTLEHELMREPTTEEIKERVESEDLVYDPQTLYPIIRLDVPRTETGNVDLHEVLYSEDVDEEALSLEFKTDLEDIIKEFPKREQTIIFMYYGIGYPRPHTLREIGSELNLTRERIRQIKEHVLIKIKRKSDGKKLLEYL